MRNYHTPQFEGTQGPLALYFDEESLQHQKEEPKKDSNKHLRQDSLVVTNPVRLNLLVEPEQEIHADLPEPEPIVGTVGLDPSKAQEVKGVKVEMLDYSLPPGFYIQDRSLSNQREVTFDKDSRVDQQNEPGLRPTETPDWENPRFEIKSPNYRQHRSPNDQMGLRTADVGKVLKFEEERPPSFSDTPVSSMKINKAPAVTTLQQPSRLDTKVFEFESNHNKQRPASKGFLNSSSLREEAGFSPIRDDTQEVQFRDSKSLQRLRDLERLHGPHKAGKVFPSYDSLAAPEPQSAVEGFGADYSAFEYSDTHSERSKPIISRFAA